jgi:hypothetical protein
MTLMTVNNHNEQGKDHRSQPRWSAGKKTEVVLRLLRGESLESCRGSCLVGHRRRPLTGSPRWSSTVWMELLPGGNPTGHLSRTLTSTQLPR